MGSTGGCRVVGIVVEGSWVVGDVEAKCNQTCGCSTLLGSVLVLLGLWGVVQAQGMGCDDARCCGGSCGLNS
jgi:hypothetical protein